MQLLSGIVVACAALSFGGTANGYLIDPDSCTGGEFAGTLRVVCARGLT